MIGVQHKLGGTLEPVAHKSDYRLSNSETGTIHTNRGATSTIVIYLPKNPPVGTEYTFSITAAYQITIVPGYSTIFAGSDAVDNKHYRASVIGSILRVCSDKNRNWIVTSKAGTWTRQT